jgi:DNA-binding beta-propeller fold protein YncE
MKKLFLSLAIVALITSISCQHTPTNYAGEYPDDVRAIVDNKCATAGCHNDKSFSNAANLRLDRWQHLWTGSNSGAVVIPYNTANSSLCYFINTDTTLGPVLSPRMPLNATALSASEYNVIKNWITSGAPDKAGNIAFASDAATRQKLYVTQQGCDLMAVIDAQTNVIMRYINLGKSPAIEIAHCVRFSPDGQYAYVSFNKGQYLQKIDVATDAVIADMYLGSGAWNLFKISDDGKKMMLGNFLAAGSLHLIDLEKMQEVASYEDVYFPHGIANTPNFDTFWVTSQNGNIVYKLNATGAMKTISIDGNDPNNTANTIDPHEIILSPDRSKYFLTCQASNEVRVMDAHTDQLLKVIPVGTFPQEFAMSHAQPYLLVSCEEEVTTEFPTYKGAVYVLNYNTMELVKRIPGPFYQIHGISIDDRNARFFVVSRNLLTTGPAPHHTSECGGRNGYYNVYDLNTLEPFTNKRFESTVDPYSADVRFK